MKMENERDAQVKERKIRHRPPPPQGGGFRKVGRLLSPLCCCGSRVNICQTWPASAAGIMGLLHITCLSISAQGRISTISLPVLITCEEMICLRKAAQTINTFT